MMPEIHEYIDEHGYRYKFNFYHCGLEEDVLYHHYDISDDQKNGIDVDVNNYMGPYKFGITGLRFKHTFLNILPHYVVSKGYRMSTHSFSDEWPLWVDVMLIEAHQTEERTCIFEGSTVSALGLIEHNLKMNLHLNGTGVKI